MVVVCITILEYIFHKLCDPFPIPSPFLFKKGGRHIYCKTWTAISTIDGCWTVTMCILSVKMRKGRSPCALVTWKKEVKKEDIKNGKEHHLNKKGEW